MGETNNRLGETNNRLAATNERLDATNERLDANSARITNYLLEMRGEVIHRLDGVDQRLDFMSNAVLNVQPLTKGMVDLGSLMAQLTRGQQHSTDRHFDLETRVARLEEKLAKLNPAA